LDSSIHKQIQITIKHWPHRKQMGIKEKWTFYVES
jgi:hypothetical protein